MEGSSCRRRDASTNCHLFPFLLLSIMCIVADGRFEATQIITSIRRIWLLTTVIVFLQVLRSHREADRNRTMLVHTAPTTAPVGTPSFLHVGVLILIMIESTQ